MIVEVAVFSLKVALAFLVSLVIKKWHRILLRQEKWKNRVRRHCERIDR